MYGIIFAILFVFLGVNIFSAPKCRNCGNKCYTSRAIIGIKNGKKDYFCTKKCAREYNAKSS